MGNPPADLRRGVALAAAGTPLLWISLESAHEAAALAGLVRAARGRRGVDPTLRLDCLVRLNPAVRPETQPGLALGAGAAWRAGFRAGLSALRLRRAALPDFDTLDAGSGFPVTTNDSPTPAHFARAAAEALAEPGADRPLRLAVEPGRAVVARSGWLLARALHVREREPRQVGLDAGNGELRRGAGGAPAPRRGGGGPPLTGAGPQADSER